MYSSAWVFLDYGISTPSLHASSFTVLARSLRSLTRLSSGANPLSSGLPASVERLGRRRTLVSPILTTLAMFF